MADLGRAPGIPGHPSAAPERAISARRPVRAPMHLMRQLGRWRNQLISSLIPRQIRDRASNWARLARRQSAGIFEAALARARIGARHAVATARAQIEICRGLSSRAAAQLTDACKWSLRQGAMRKQAAERALRSGVASGSAGLTASARHTCQRLSAALAWLGLKVRHALGLALMRMRLFAPFTGAAGGRAPSSERNEPASDGSYRIEVA